MDKSTPAMQQYYDLKAQYEDAILFFRMWDFYEMFATDAEIAHKVLWINITSRNKNAVEPIALAGIPYHALDKYLPQLVHAGYKVAIAEQTSDSNLKWIVKREVVRVVTPATIWLEWENYETKDTSNIVSLSYNNNEYGLSIIELSSNTWKTWVFFDTTSLSTELYKLYPKEIILSKSLFENGEIQTILKKKFSLNIYFFEPQKNPKKVLLQHFSTKNLHAFGIEDKTACIISSAMILEYLSHNQKSKLDHLDSLSFTNFEWYMELDESTIKNLDLLYNFATNSEREGTLLWVLDKTKTAMGKRKIRENIIRPFQDKDTIESRHKVISCFVNDKILLDSIQKELSQVADIEAILTRLSLGRAWPRDLLNLKRSLKSIQNVITKIQESENKELISLLKL